MSDTRKALEAGKVINQVLTSDATIKGYIGNKVYPLIADKGTTFPFIIYRRSSITPVDSKEGIYVTSAYYSVAIAAESYKDSISIARAVVGALTSAKGEIQGLNIQSISLTQSNEYWDDEFVQELTFKIDIDDE